MDAKTAPKTASKNNPAIPRDSERGGQANARRNGESQEGDEAAMIEFGMNVEGIEELQRALDRLPRLMHTSVNRALDRVGADIHMDARRMCPVRTGFLRDSIYHKVEDWILTVGAKATYAAYVELGTHFIEPHYFLTEAFHLNFPNLERVLKWALNAAIETARSET